MTAKYPITESTSLTPFLKRALQCDFDCYLTEQVIPMWRARSDGGSLLQLVDQVSLYALKDYLHSSPKIAVMHNADDVILGPGDLGFLRKTFGDRLTVYPLGGHCPPPLTVRRIRDVAVQPLGRAHGPEHAVHPVEPRHRRPTRDDPV